MFSAKLVHRLKAVALAGPVILMLGLPLAGCGDDSKETAAPDNLKVTAAEAKAVKIPRTASFNGALAAREMVEVRARVSGYLAEKLFEEGAVVHAGQVLYKLDDRDLRAALDAAQVTTAKAKAAWESEDAARKRMVALADKGAISLQRRDDAVARAEEALTVYQAAQAEEEKAAVNLGYAAIAAPTAGLVSRSNVEVGGNVDADSATLLTTIYSIDPIRVEFSVTEGEYARMRQVIKENRGRPEAMIFTLLSGDDKVPYRHSGVLEMADPVIDPKTNTVAVRVDFPNPDQVLRPGMRVNLEAVMDVFEAVTVPEAAVMDQAGAKAVYAIDDQDQVVSTPVKTGQAAGGDRIILEGLAPGRKVIVGGMDKVRPGLTVEVAVDEAESRTGK